PPPPQALPEAAGGFRTFRRGNGPIPGGGPPCKRAPGLSSSRNLAGYWHPAEAGDRGALSTRAKRLSDSRPDRKKRPDDRSPRVGGLPDSLTREARGPGPWPRLKCDLPAWFPQ